MAALQDHDYLKICAELASCLSISIASARRQVELAAMREGVKDLDSRKAIAERLLQEAKSQASSSAKAASAQLDQLLKAVAKDENFMVED